MENKHATYSPAFHLISWIALIGGIVTYLVGLWNADMQLNEKGYYFAAAWFVCLYGASATPERTRIARAMQKTE